MLVLTRKAGEAVRIDDRIVITVVRIAGGAVRIGIEAPPEVPIMREEVAAAIDEEPLILPFVDALEDVSE